MSQKFKVQLPPEKVNDLKEKYGLSDEALQDMLSSLKVQPGPDASLPVTSAATAVASREASEEENDPFMNSLNTLAKKGGGDMAEVLAFTMLSDTMERREDRREDRRYKQDQRQKTNSDKSNPATEAVKTEISDLKKTVESLVESLKEKERDKAQQEFAESVTTSILGKVMPALDSLQNRVSTMETGATPDANIATEMKEAIEALGETLATKVKVGNITVDDFEPIFSLIDRLEARMKKGESSGELNWQTVAVNTIGEISKEAITAARDIEKARVGTETIGEPKPTGETKPQPVMRGIIKRQLQNYILAQMQGGATQLNLPSAARQLGLTQPQVFQAYQDLVKEGWFQTVTQGSEQPEQRTETQIEAQAPEERGIFTRTEAVFTA